MRKNRWLRWIGAPFRIVFYLYTLLIALLIIARALVDERWVVVEMFNNILPVPLLPVIAILLFALVLRQVPLIALSLPGIAALLLWYGAYFVPQDIPPAQADETVLRVVSYNTYAFRASADDIIDVILAVDADVVALQELNLMARLRLTEALLDVYPYQALDDEQGIYSRFPVISESAWRVNGRDGYQRAILRVGTQPLVIYNIHPRPPVHPRRVVTGGFDGSDRRDAVDDLMARLAAEQRPTIIAGDLNLGDQNAALRRLTSRYPDSYTEAGFGFGSTYPNWQFAPIDVPQSLWRLPPVIRIDYLLHNNQKLRTLEAFVHPDTGGSDHYPVVASFALEP